MFQDCWSVGDGSLIRVCHNRSWCLLTFTCFCNNDDPNPSDRLPMIRNWSVPYGSFGYDHYNWSLPYGSFVQWSALHRLFSHVHPYQCISSHWRTGPNYQIHPTRTCNTRAMKICQTDPNICERWWGTTWPSSYVRDDGWCELQKIDILIHQDCC